MSETSESTASATDPHVARREKLHALAELGLDPWGQRIDDHAAIGDLRARAGEVRYKLETGAELPLPDFSVPDFNFRQWKADNGKGEVVGPTVRAAGRIRLLRTAGKLVFMDLVDQTGRLQLMVGKQQVGDTWAVVEQLDLGDLIAVDGTLGFTNTGELSIFATKVHFLTKSLEPPPEKHHGLADPELRQRMRYVDMAYNDGVTQRFLARSRIVRSVRETLGTARLRGSRRPHAPFDCRRRRRPTV